MGLCETKCEVCRTASLLQFECQGGISLSKMLHRCSSFEIKQLFSPTDESHSPECHTILLFIFFVTETDNYKVMNPECT